MLTLTVPFEEHLHQNYLERIKRWENKKAKKFVEEHEHDIPLKGFYCKACNEIKPLYCYKLKKV